MADSELKRTPLYDRHVALGAKMVPFGGWCMPVQYTSIVEEHKACRGEAALFDVSHMGEFRLSGAGALAFLQKALTNNYANLAVGRCRYSLLCAPDGGVVDDLIVYCLAENEYGIIVNAANIDTDFAWMQNLGTPDCTLVNHSSQWGLIALQGPASKKILADLLTPEDAAAVAALRYYAFCPATVCGCRVNVSRTGYTGSFGYELMVKADETGKLWDGLLAAGKGDGLLPAGLGARDTLRLEAGFCLDGNDITREHNPIEARLERFVKFEKGDFIGKEALAAVAAKGPERLLCGIKVTGKGMIREHSEISSNGVEVGVMTSGSYSPMFGISIGLGYVRADLAEPGTPLDVMNRGRAVACEVAALPFYQTPKKA